MGTAGHIDHGKSALVKALTGIDPDRLEEEKRRGMTIDLGFAHFDLPGGRRVGIVDVPGHERLIRNMLAGATGIDLVLLVIAADEGVMPQTREHLDILRFLDVDRGIVVLNKVDLVSDPEWLPLVTEDIRALIAGTFLEGAPVVPVSARTGAGLPRLVAAIEKALAELPARQVDAPTRIPVDRSFTMAGFGTVVTGTLWTGRVRTGDALELLPAGRELRVRHVQSHGAEVTEAVAGQRVALNIVGATKDEIARGDVLVSPRSLAPTMLFDARIRLLAGAPPVGHHERVRVYVGADEVIGRLRLLDRSKLGPGDTAVAQVRLERPAVVARGDPFVLRRYSPMVTVGGGEVITAHAAVRRRGAAAAAAVVADEASEFEDQLKAALVSAGRAGTTVEAIARHVGAGGDHVVAQVHAWVAAGQAIDLRGRVFSRDVSRAVEEDILRALAVYHGATPWRRGMPRDELKARAFGSGDDRLYGHALDTLAVAGRIVIQDWFVRLVDFSPGRSPTEEAARGQIEEAFRRGRYAPPARDEILASVRDHAVAVRMLQALLDDGALVNVGGEILFHGETLLEIKAQVAAHIAAHGEITVAVLRDRLKTSRKYALTVLEYFDTIRVTRRVGDTRVLVRPANSSPTHRPPS
ncbi:MAG TPA: selenocysteine-specific translation elongation factor [bacterium]|nr:selenocysteine-specific translation elongation factor [bacterium]